MKSGLWAVCVVAFAAFSGLNSTARGQYVTQLDASNHVAPSVNLVVSHPSSRGVRLGDYLYFIADTPAMYSGIWRTDGTPQGTSPVWFDPRSIDTPFGASWGGDGMGPNALFAGPGNCVLGIMHNETPTAVLVRIDADGVARPIYPRDSTDQPLPLLDNGIQVNLFSNVCTTGGNSFLLLQSIPPQLPAVWVTDGTYEGTRRVMTFRQSIATNNRIPYWGAGLNGRFFFVNTAPNNSASDNPWVSDGTPEGTFEIADIHPSQPADSSHFATLGGFVYFIAIAPDNRRMIFRTDGTAVGTDAVCPAPPLSFSGSSDRPPLSTSYGIFYHGGNNADQLWAFDGTNVRNLNIRLLSGTSANGQQMSVINDRLYYASDNGGLYRIDPGLAGSTLVAFATPRGAFGEIAYLNASPGQSNRWFFNGALCYNSSQVVSLLPSVSSIKVRMLGALDDRVVFACRTSITNQTDREVYSSDGTVNGTIRLADVGGYASGTSLRHLSRHAGQDYLKQTRWTGTGTAAAGTELARLSNTDMFDVIDIPGIPSREIANLWRVGEQFVCTTRASGSTSTNILNSPSPTGPYSLVRSTLAGTFSALGSTLFYSDCSSNPCSTWVFDSLSGNTYQISSEPFFGTFSFNSSVYVMTRTSSSTTRFSSFDDGQLTPLAEVNSPYHYFKASSTTFALLDDQSNRLIAFDGSTFTPLPLYQAYGLGTLAAPMNSMIVFAATEYSNGFKGELYISDGTIQGTRRLKDIHPGIEGSSPQDLTILQTPQGPRVFFSAFTPETGRELWVTDGTTEGTVPVIDLNPGVLSSSPNSMIEWNGQLLFMAFHPEHGHELFISDGTAQGTRLFHEFVPGLDGVRRRAIDIFKSESGRVLMNVYRAGNLFVDPYLISDRCPADFNTDGTLDIFDYLDFAAAFATGDPSSDFNGDSVLDLFDYLDFVRLYSGGC